jgi:hypothetical protein
MKAAALFKQIFALKLKLKALTKEWDHAKAAEADVTILDSNGQPLPTKELRLAFEMTFEL